MGLDISRGMSHTDNLPPNSWLKGTHLLFILMRYFKAPLKDDDDDDWNQMEFEVNVNLSSSRPVSNTFSFT